MIIRELNLKNFGKFSNESFRFGEGINVIYGPNGAGKTTIYHAIAGLLFGIDKQRGRAARNDIYITYRPWENPTWYEGSLRFETGGKLFRLERNFYHNEKSARLVCETDGEELSVEQGDLDMLLGDLTGELYVNTAAAGQLKMKPQEIVYSYLKNYIAGLQESGKGSVDVVGALNILEKKKKALEQQKKKQAEEIGQMIAGTDAKLEMTEKEINNLQIQLESVRGQKAAKDHKVQPGKTGFLAKLFGWFQRLFFRKRLQREEQQKREEQLKLEEKMILLQELLGEKESRREELIMEKDSFYEKLHEQSKEEEIKAVELAMERIRGLSTLQREEIMEKLLNKSSEVLRQITKGKFQKLVLDDSLEPSVWDGHRSLNLFQISGGSAEQVYLAIRIGMQDLFFEEDPMPLLFDDSFVYFDDKRLECLLMCLSELGRQVLIFSCHKREIRILERNHMPYEKILL